MRNLVIVLVAVVTVTSCKKKQDPATGNCFAGAKTVGYVNNKTVTVKQITGGYILSPDSTFDTWYIPCNLPAANQVNNLQLVIDAEIKENDHYGQPCCAEDIVITKLAVK